MNDLNQEQPSLEDRVKLLESKVEQLENYLYKTVTNKINSDYNEMGDRVNKP